MKINRKQILESFLNTVANISDKNYQIRTWIKGQGPECDDFDETVCHFFQDGNGIIEDYKEFGLTKKQYEILVKFRNAFDAFADDNDFAPEFIDTPEWASIMEQAKEVLEAFHYQKE